MTDFFISYTHVDEAWAEWIGYVLEEEGFSVLLQAWDFRPGSNFVLEMHKAANAAQRTIMVLSPDYLQSQFASPEWAAAFSQDPQGLKLKLVPVMVRACQPVGLLSPIVQIRIADLNENQARAQLLAGISQKRAKPSGRPTFPGSGAAPTPKVFPGLASHPVPAAAPSLTLTRRSSVLPPLNRIPTDLEKRRFVQSGIATIKQLFEENLARAEQENNHIQTDFQISSATEFRAEIFVDGKSACICRIWLGGMHSENNICYAEGRHMSVGSYNEAISLADGGRSLGFHATMNMGYLGTGQQFDTSNMTPDQMAEYLWEGFVASLGH